MEYLEAPRASSATLARRLFSEPAPALSPPPAEHAWTDDDAESLCRQLEVADGSLVPVRLVRGSWLLRRAEELRRARTDAERRQLAVPRRQELEDREPHAFLSAAEVRALPRGRAFITAAPLRLIAISHMWLTKDHPDPLGQQLVAFADEVRRQQSPLHHTTFFALRLVARALLCMRLPVTVFPDGEFAVFYDFVSLHQKDPHTGERTPSESHAFQRALDRMGSFYASPLTSTYCLARLPPGWDRLPTYSERGWCSFEQAASVLSLARGSAAAFNWPQHVEVGTPRRHNHRLRCRRLCRRLTPDPFAVSSPQTGRHAPRTACRADGPGLL